MLCKRIKAFSCLSILTLCVLMNPFESIAECYCNLSEPLDVIVQNWQTFKPKVTALHSLNAFLATDLGEQVYYVPTLEELPNVRNRMYDCEDYKGTRKQFAAIYDGYFDTECYDALVRKSDGTYTRTPEIIKNEGSGSARELTTLGYDFLLTLESIILTDNGDRTIGADYKTMKLNLDNGSVDLSTAIMDIYKAIGQEKFDLSYAFTIDDSLTVETSPIQKEIHLQLANGNEIDTSDGAGWVFATRTNPSLYWVQAVRDGVIYDSEALGATDGGVSGSTVSKTQTLTLAEFCAYAYTIMDIYGEPTISSSERNVLLQLYGTSIPYKSVDSFAVEAVEAFIAKGIISPDDDREYLNWNTPINPKYFLTLLMRIADTDARMTYKDVQITMDAALLDKGYYATKVSVERSSIIDLKVDPRASYASTYMQYRVSESEVRSKFGSDYGRENSLFTTTHLVIEKDGQFYPLNTMVTTNNVPMLVERSDGQSPSIPFGECTGWDDRNLLLSIAVFPVNDLMTDGVYKLRAISSDGLPVGSAIDLTPGSYNIDSTGDDYTLPDGLLGYEVDFDNGEHYEYYPDDLDLAPSSSTVILMEVEIGSESDIVFKPKDSHAPNKTLAEIMLTSSEEDGGHLLNPEDSTDIRIYKVSDGKYQVSGVRSKEDLSSRIVEQKTTSTAMEGFCYRDSELLVSTDWLKETGFITSNSPEFRDDIMVLKTRYNEIYLNKARKLVIAGSMVYRLSDLKEEEIWYETDNGDYIVNFRAIFGWTGDHLIFKDSESGVITVSMKGLPSDASNPYNGSNYALTIKMLDVSDTINYNGIHWSSILAQGDLSQTIQGSIDRSKTTIPMSVTYPFANWFIYSSPKLFGTSGTDDDWLFVFKPKEISVNGRKIEYDDTAARQQLEAVLGKLSLREDNIAVWAYRLYKGSGERSQQNPVGMNFSNDYGWSYTPQECTDESEFFENYFDTEVAGSDTRPSCVLPLIMDSDKNLRCVNYNSYSYNVGGDIQYLDYGQIPVNDIASSSESKVLNAALKFMQGINIVEAVDDVDDLSNYHVCPTIVSPALWCAGFNEISFDDIADNLSTALVLRGTSKLTFKKNSDGEVEVFEGRTKLDPNEMKNTKFLLIRSDTATGSIRHIYSESQLSSFTLNSSIMESVANEFSILGTGIKDAIVDSIDWEEFTASRLLEDFEFVIAISLVFVLTIIPRFCLFMFILLLGLAVIRDIKLVQRFCDRWFDPYSFLTAGRLNVHTFNSGIMFRNSIIAMAVFALFMDGTIIHVYEWIARFVVYLVAH